jgi:NADH-quinone oxidoreductase subunit A
MRLIPMSFASLRIASAVRALRAPGSTTTTIASTPVLDLTRPGQFFIFALLAAALPLGTIIAARAIQTRRPNPAKLEPYECGIEATTSAFDTRFSVRYFLIAVLFVVFDVETIFLFPWAIMFHRLGLFGLVEMLVFLVILVVGYVYCWKRNALDWA